MNRIQTFSQFKGSQNISEGLRYHIDNNISICESVFRPGSESHISLLKEARSYYFEGALILDDIDARLFENTDLGKTATFNGKTVALDLVLEAEYRGKEVELNKPKRGGSKKFVVYVKNPKTGKILKIQFGDPGMTSKVSDPKARKSFAARHRCKDKKDRTKAGYWACRVNRYAHLWGGKTYPGYW